MSKSKSKANDLFYYQQGDVLLKKVDEVPAAAREISDRILQRGETTGHKHQFYADASVKIFETPSTTAPGMRITELNGEKYIVVESPSALYHEEHKPITVDPGIYKLDIVREYDYEKDEMTRVRD